jgi:hypothetical protein
MTPEVEKDFLKQQVEGLQEQLSALQKRLGELEENE